MQNHVTIILKWIIFVLAYLIFDHLLKNNIVEDTQIVS